MHLRKVQVSPLLRPFFKHTIRFTLKQNAQFKLRHQIQLRPGMKVYTHMERCMPGASYGTLPIKSDKWCYYAGYFTIKVFNLLEGNAVQYIKCHFPNMQTSMPDLISSNFHSNSALNAGTPMPLHHVATVKKKKESFGHPLCNLSIVPCKRICGFCQKQFGLLALTAALQWQTQGALISSGGD